MSWTDVHGTIGSYTGEVNCLNVPDGMGSMRYDDRGIVAEGMWRDGEIDNDDNHESSDGNGSVFESDDDDDNIYDEGMVANARKMSVVR